MDGFGGKMALEAAKPASGFLTAILGPKIEDLKKWSEERDLKGKLDKEHIACVMRPYLEKLSYRVGEVTSIAFSQVKLNIFDAYEPLCLTKNDARYRDEEIEVDIELMVKTDKGGFLIIDDAGMGKSTFSKYLVSQILYKSNRIPILFELRRLSVGDDLIDSLAAELDLPGRRFDREVFYRLIELGKFYIVLDGFDEVEIEFQENLSMQIYDMSVKGGDNVLLLTSRRQDALPDISNSFALRFIPFTKEKASSLILRYDKISGLDVGERLNKEIDTIPEKFIESPLLVSLLYRTYGVNGSIAARVSTFYDEIYSALYKGHDLINKNGFVRDKKSGLDYEEFRKVLRALCYYMMIRRKSSFHSYSEACSIVDEAKKICGIDHFVSSEYLEDLLGAVPLMQRDGSEFKFMHKTIQEYFSAEYLIYNKSSYELLRKLFNSKLFSGFSKVFEFLADIDRSLFDSVITLHHAKKAPDVSGKNNEFSVAAKTIFFLRKVKMGLWKVSDYSENVGFDDSEVQVLSSECHVAGGLSHTSWWSGVLNGEEYMIAITHDEGFEGFHKLAFEGITKKTSFGELPVDDYCYDLNGLDEVLGINQWVDINYKELCRLYDCNEITKIFVNDLLFEALISSGVGVRVLCQKKIDAVFEGVETSLRNEMELDKFLF
ncbi:hypothetical protein Q670_03255 [Alcanivorax sp. P2S70]|uniref:NACHT domain-containing protein n=1 Tax=Alcanivorax sp. P2S70 TaxID=1397527 RepID=UPI0003B492CE|nr:hypothetical protein [Alcanivorax sp. P2S70]ERP89416.1 hypothetical protein Q670_03255 [Alcanivorax sp. P2S70]